MRFTEYLSAGGNGVAPDGVHPDLGVICFEDGTCVGSSGQVIGARQDPSGVRTPPNPHRIYADGTGGPFVYRGDRPGGGNTVAPQPVSREGNPQAGLDFALLLDLLRQRRR